MKPTAVSNFAILSLVIGATSASAHHAAGAYDKDHNMTQKVVLEKFVWENPHLQFEFVAKNPNGSSTRWLLEAAPPIRFLRGGVKASDFNKGVGTTVTMTWCGTKAGIVQGGRMLGYWDVTTFADGSQISNASVNKVPPPAPGKCG